jgi:hypothetical protein
MQNYFKKLMQCSSPYSLTPIAKDCENVVLVKGRLGEMKK